MEVPLTHRATTLVAALGAVFIASAGAAAPLCHDLKGLFTPCPRDSKGRIADTPVDHAAAVVHVQKQEAAEQEARVRHHREHPQEPDKPPLFKTGKLCRDSKGLFKPC